MYELYNLYNGSIQKNIDSYSIARENVKNEYEKILFEFKLENEKEKNILKLNLLN